MEANAEQQISEEVYDFLHIRDDAQVKKHLAIDGIQKLILNAKIAWWFVRKNSLICLTLQIQQTEKTTRKNFVGH